MSASRLCQRWRHGRNVFRTPENEIFRKDQYSVDVIEERDARAFVLEHHYSRSMPVTSARIGLFSTHARLVGVAVFSVPMNQAVLPRYCGTTQGLELGRFVLLDECPANSETFFLGRAFRLLRQLKPNLSALVSYSDPMPRRDASGLTLLGGHFGIVYQAFNGRYHGTSAARTLHITRSGTVVSPRTVSKIRLGERGAVAAERRLLAMGAPGRQAGESGAQWVERVLSCGLFTPVRHPGNHVYSWSLAGRQCAAPTYPYPKPDGSHLPQNLDLFERVA